MSSVAGVMDNRTIIAKADLALANLTSDGGILQPAQAAKFMRVMVKASKLLGMSTVVPMKSHKQLVEKIRFGSRILRAGNEGVALPEGERSKPDLSKVQLSAELFKAEVRLDNEVLEDSIEKSELRQTIMQLMGEAIARDVEEVAINGDTTSTDPTLAKINGALALATLHTVNAGTVALNKGVLRDMMKTMPNEYLRDKKTLRYMTSVNAEIGYRDYLADRGTQGGDAYLAENAPINYNGIRVDDIPLFPENLGGGTNCTDVLLSDPKNFNVGIWRNIRVETDKMVSEGVLVIVASLRFDVKWAVADAVVKATNVLVG